jgi:hypothetical protein
MKRWTTLTTSILLALVLAASTASAQAAQQDEAWRDEPRHLSLERTTDQLHFRSERTSDLGEDRLDVRYHRDTGRLEYRFTAFDGTGEGTQIIYTTTLLALVEHRIADEEDPYGADTQIVERYRLQELERRPLERQAILQGLGYRAVAEYVIPDRRDRDDGPLADPVPLGDGTLRITLTMVERPRSVQQEPLVPTQLLVDIEIIDHPFTAADTRLALETSLTGTRMDRLNINETSLSQQAGHYQGLLEWSPTVTLGTTHQEAQLTLMSLPGPEQTEHRLTSTYPQHDNIRHTWSLETHRFKEIPQEILELITRGDPLLFTGAAAVALALAGIPVAKRLREPR